MYRCRHRCSKYRLPLSLSLSSLQSSSFCSFSLFSAVSSFTLLFSASVSYPPNRRAYAHHDTTTATQKIGKRRRKTKITAKLSRVVGGLESVAEALKLEARRLMPGAKGLVEAEGDLKLVVLLRERYLVAGVHITVVEDVSGFQRSSLLSEWRVFKTFQILK